MVATAEVKMEEKKKPATRAARRKPAPWLNSMSWWIQRDSRRMIAAIRLRAKRREWKMTRRAFLGGIGEVREFVMFGNGW